MKIVQIYRDGNMEDIKIKMNVKSYLTLLNKKSKHQGNGSIQELFTWIYENDKIKCYGWYDGENGFENKHKLVPGGFSSFLEEDSSKQVLYGDLFICRIKKNKVIDLDISDYGEFYTNACGDLHNSDEEEYINLTDDDNSSDDDNEIIIKEDDSDIENEYEIIFSNEDQLEEDTTEY